MFTLLFSLFFSFNVVSHTSDTIYIPEVDFGKVTNKNIVVEDFL